MQQRRECREKSGGVLEEVGEGKGVENVEEVREVGDRTEDPREIDGGNGEGSLEIADGAGVAAAAAFWSVA
jgi:hypothetical protein